MKAHPFFIGALYGAIGMLPIALVVGALWLYRPCREAMSEPVHLNGWSVVAAIVIMGLRRSR